MDQELLASRLEQLPGGVLLVGFAGTAGVGSRGNEHGKQLGMVLQRAIAEFRPTALLIDFRSLDYRFGDWIGAAVLVANKQFGQGRVCVVAEGETGKALSTLWDLGLKKIIPLMHDMQEAFTYLGIPKPCS